MTCCFRRLTVCPVQSPELVITEFLDFLCSLLHFFFEVGILTAGTHLTPEILYCLFQFLRAPSEFGFDFLSRLQCYPLNGMFVICSFFQGLPQIFSFLDFVLRGCIELSSGHVLPLFLTHMVKGW